MTAVLLHASLAAVLLWGGSLDAAETTPRRSPLEAVPFPSLAPLEPAVAEQVRGFAIELDAVLSSSTTTDAALAGTFGELGQLFHAYELWDSAAASYRNARRLAPGDYRWPHLLADVETHRGDLAAARQMHLAALAVQPGDVPSLVGLGEACLGLNRLDEAERALREAATIAPASAAAHAGLARVALVRRAFAQARDELLAALRLAPAANRLHYELAMAYRGLGNREEAARHLAAVGTVGVRPADPLLDAVSARRQGERVHLVRGRLAFANGRMREAADEFAAAVAAEPHSVPGLVGLGSALGSLGESDRALDAFRRALALAPDNVSAHFNLARIFAARKEWDAAISHYEAVLAAEPGDAEAAAGLAEARAHRSARD